MQSMPHYPIEAVDNALLLIRLLRRGGRVRVSEAAAELGIARSTSHRMLRMLVYRGFAVQCDDRSYAVGPELAFSVPPAEHGHLCNRLRPAMREIREILDETVSLLVLEKDKAVFVDCVEAVQPLHIRPRVGSQMPAERNSGGKVLLSQLPQNALRMLYAHRDDLDVRRLEVMLANTRRQGYGLNVNESDPGVAAVGVCVTQGDGRPAAALTVSTPTLRFRRARGAEIAKLMRDAISRTSSL